MASYWLSDLMRSLVRSLCDAERGLRAGHMAYGVTTASMPRVAELSVEFTCCIDYRWNPKRQCEDARLRLGRRSIFWFRRPLHRVRIVCRHDDDWQPILHIDGSRARPRITDAWAGAHSPTETDALSTFPIKE